MRGWKKTAAVCLALVLLLTGCGGKSFYEALGEITGQGHTVGVFNGKITRMDTDYTRMDLGDFTQKKFAALVDAFDALAENGGKTKDFDAAESNLREGLYKLYTQYVLLSNAAYADTENAQLAARADEARRIYRDAYDEYMLAHKRLAKSSRRDLLESGFSQSYIDYFASYEPSNGEESSLSREENELISRYYALAGDIESNAGELGEIFVRLVELRKTMASLYGYDSYADLAYDAFYIRSYTPEDARTLWQGARDWFAPLVWDAMERVSPLAAAMESDAGIDCSPDAVMDALGKMAGRLSPELKTAYDYLMKYHLYDIAPSLKKAQVGFTVFLYYYNEPFIFNSPSGTFYDYTDTAHEFGHFVSYFYNPSELIFGIADNDLSELQSQGMSVVMSTLFGELFGDTRGQIMRDCVLLELAVSVVDGAMYDEFQQRVFETEDLTPERVDEIFSEVYLSYGYEPYAGYEREWMGVAHNFEMPFYYISYAVSALGALEINERCEADFDAGLADYLKILSMDPELWYYTEAMEEAGLSDFFDSSTYEDIADALARSLQTGMGAAA